ncbi:hypothetical protein ADUPG1_002484, partial [Aduncisulcus paluster]
MLSGYFKPVDSASFLAMSEYSAFSINSVAFTVNKSATGRREIDLSSESRLEAGQLAIASRICGVFRPDFAISEALSGKAVSVQAFIPARYFKSVLVGKFKTDSAFRSIVRLHSKYDRGA